MDDPAPSIPSGSARGEAARGEAKRVRELFAADRGVRGGDAGDTKSDDVGVGGSTNLDCRACLIASTLAFMTSMLFSRAAASAS